MQVPAYQANGAGNFPGASKFKWTFRGSLPRELPEVCYFVIGVVLHSDGIALKSHAGCRKEFQNERLCFCQSISS